MYFFSKNKLVMTYFKTRLTETKLSDNTEFIHNYGFSFATNHICMNPHLHRTTSIISKNKYILISQLDLSVD